MGIDLTGILSTNEYYTQHYLDTVLEVDIKDIIKEFMDKNENSKNQLPWNLLSKSVRSKYYKQKELLDKEKNIEKRLYIQREFLIELFSSLGYEINNKVNYIPVSNDVEIPVLHEIRKNNGLPLLWILEVVDEYGDEGDLLHNKFRKLQYEQESDHFKEIKDLDLEKIITQYIFYMEEPPRWILLCNLNEIILIDRGKWQEKRTLNFKLDDILSRKIESTLKAMTVLLHKETICPNDNISFLDKLDENSHKHATSVSESLKYALRQSIELLGNDAIRYKKNVLRNGVYDRDLAPQLTIECLRYMYRILFLLYIEARPELGYAPMKSEEYLKGYSIESLREIVDNAKLDTDKERNGTYIDTSIKKLFNLIYNGFIYSNNNTSDQIDGLLNNSDIEYKIFRMEPLKSHLFDPDKTPLLNTIKFSNETLVEVITKMSISEPKNKKERPGRISYAQLGINQLGAVYEALLSYRGFFAEENLYEVRRAGDKSDELEVGYFVTESQLGEYTEDERVRNNDGSLKVYPKGSFIYRLAGREREKSASYYTPEVLTQCLVKYSLKELLKDKKADDILDLKICEPAMGSAAFLNEAINQLAEEYLKLKQKELGESIPHDRYTFEKQRVKMYIADRNVYGIDLNPVAVELGEVSLWLNTIYKGAFVPWFNLQLVCGNSLIGARKQVYDTNYLNKTRTYKERWYNFEPRRVIPGKSRYKNEIYHFLLGDEGMVDYDDKVIKELAKENIHQIKEWKSEFNKEYTEEQVKQLLRLCDVIDKLWEKHTKFRKEIMRKTKDRFSIYGHEINTKSENILSIKEKDELYSKYYKSENLENSGPYARLKLVMDYWCSLWFWPIEQSDLLPTRDEFLFELSLILEGNVFNNNEGKISDSKKNVQIKINDDLGRVNLDEICNKIPRLKIVKELSNKYKFNHWELEFADIFEERRGFDLVLGNPPWKKVKWNASCILGDTNPKVIVKNYSAPKIYKERDILLNTLEKKSEFLNSFEEISGQLNYFNSVQNYAELKGMQSDLYQCFITRSWLIGNENSNISLIHPESIYTDAEGDKFRIKLYRKLRYHFQFRNVKSLFPIKDGNKFSINIYSNKASEEFSTIANLFEPKTIDECFEDNKITLLDGIKDSSGQWNVKGHQDRIIKVSNKELKIFYNAFDESKASYEGAKLPAIHAKQLIHIIEKFANINEKLSELDCYTYTSQMWDETHSVDNGVIKAKVEFPLKISDTILQGPHISNSNPLFQSARRDSKSKASFDYIDLENIKEMKTYLPRTKFSPNSNNYYEKIPKIKNGKKYTDVYRLAFRKMLSPQSLSTLMSAIIPPKVSHTNSIYSIYIEDYHKLLLFSSLTSSIVYDFYIKVTGKANILDNLLYRLPIPDNFLSKYLIIRGLKLNCITEYYDDLWNITWEPSFRDDFWAKKDRRLNNNRYSQDSPIWDINSAFRNEYERRQALVEIDVLSAMAVGITLEELKDIYRIQFYVLRDNESDTWYDQNGKIIFTTNKSLSGVGLKRKEWNEIKDIKSGKVVHTIVDDTIPNGPIERTIVYEAPFDRCDREKDYEEVWKNFEQRFGGIK